MSTVRSIIIFNGGSAGDFLRSVCLEQLTGFSKYWVDPNGRIRYPIVNNYFKELCIAEQRTQQHQPVDSSQCHEVEHAHAYYDWFQSLTANLFYIHYDDNDTLSVVETFIRKSDNTADFDKWIKQTMPTHIPEELLAKVNQENVVEVLSIFWKKNIRTWQLNSKLTPIPLRDLFEITLLTKWVERLCGQALTDPVQLANTHQAWLNKNSILLTTLT